MSFTVTATQGGSTNLGMSTFLKVLTGAKPTSAQNGATLKHTSASENVFGFAITPNATGSWIYGAMNGIAGGTTNVFDANTTFLQSVSGSGLDYVQYRGTSKTTASSAQTLGTTNATQNAVTLSMAEILASGTLTEDASSPAGSGVTAGTFVATPAFTPPLGSLLVLMVSTDGGAGTTTMAITDTSGLGLVWTSLIADNDAGFGYTGVFIAQMPSAPSSIASPLAPRGNLGWFPKAPGYPLGTPFDDYHSTFSQSAVNVTDSDTGSGADAGETVGIITPAAPPKWSTPGWFPGAPGLPGGTPFDSYIHPYVTVISSQQITDADTGLATDAGESLQVTLSDSDTGLATDSNGTGAPGFSVSIVQTGDIGKGMAAELKVLTGASTAQPGATFHHTSVSENVFGFSITPNGTGSYVYGAMLGNEGTTTPFDSNTTFLNDDHGNSLEYIDYRSTNRTTAGVAQTLGTTSATVNALSLAMAEILGTPVEDASSPAVIPRSTDVSQVLTLNPPVPGSLLVLMISSNGGNTTVGMSITDTSGLGLNWVELVKDAATGNGYTGVWIAQVPASPIVTAPRQIAPDWFPKAPGLPLGTPFDVYIHPYTAVSAATQQISDSDTGHATEAGSPTGPVVSIGTPTTTHASAGSVTGTWGTGQNRTAGNTLVALVSAAGTTSVSGISGPAGWVNVAEIGNTPAAQHVDVAVFTRLATGADAAPTFTATENTATGEGMDVTLYELAGADPNAPVDTSALFASGSSSGTISMTATTGLVGADQEFALSIFAQERSSQVASNTWADSASFTASTISTASSRLSTVCNKFVDPTPGATLTDSGQFATNTVSFGAGAIIVFKNALSSAPAAKNDSDGGTAFESSSSRPVDSDAGTAFDDGTVNSLPKSDSDAGGVNPATGEVIPGTKVTVIAASGETGTVTETTSSRPTSSDSGTGTETQSVAVGLNMTVTFTESGGNAANGVAMRVFVLNGAKLIQASPGTASDSSSFGATPFEQIIAPTVLSSLLYGATADNSSSSPFTPDAPTTFDENILDSGGAGVQPSGPAGNWSLSWSDEFTGSSLDTNKWYASTGGEIRSNTPMFASNVSVSGGQLHLQSLSAVGGGCEIHSSGALTGRTDPPNGYRVPVGGVLEARVALQGDGTFYYGWPSFWTYDGGNSEVDIIEVNGWSGGTGASLTINYHNAGATQGTVPGGYWGSGVFHTYTLKTTATTFTIWWDGTQVFTTTRNDDGLPLGIILDNAAGYNTHTGFPNSMHVDYVRAWLPGTAGKSYGIFHKTTPVSTLSPVIIGANGPASQQGCCAMAEVIPAIAGIAPVVDASSPPAVSAFAGLACTTASFIPPQNALIVACVSAQGDGLNSAAYAVTDSRGLTWTKVIESNVAGTGYSAVYTVTAPGKYDTEFAAGTDSTGVISTTQRSDSDAGTGTETFTIITTTGTSSSDTGTALEAGTPNTITRNDADTFIASSENTSINAPGVHDADTATGLEAQNVNLIHKTDGDTGVFFDVNVPKVGTSDGDTTNAQDHLLVSDTDISTSDDEEFTNNSPKFDSDAGTGNDSTGIISPTSATANDAISFIELPNWTIALTDTTDTATGTDSNGTQGKLITGTGAQDTGHGTDGGENQHPGAHSDEFATATETTSIAATGITDGDSATASDSVSSATRLLTSNDTATGNDAHISIGILPNTGDAGSALDTSGANFGIITGDTGTFTETVITVSDPNHKFDEDNAHATEAQSVHANIHDGDNGYSSEYYAIDQPGIYRYVDEAFSFSRLAILDPSTGTETVQVFGVQAGSVTLNFSAYDNTADDTLISTWFSATTASLQFTCGFTTWAALAFTGVSEGTNISNITFKAAVALWTEYMSTSPRVALAVRTVSRDLYGHHRLGVPDYDPGRTLDVIFYDVRLKYFAPGAMSFRTGMTFTVTGTAYLTTEDEANNPLLDANGNPYSSIGRIASSPHNLTGQLVSSAYGQGT